MFRVEVRDKQAYYSVADAYVILVIFHQNSLSFLEVQERLMV